MALAVGVDAVEGAEGGHDEGAERVVSVGNKSSRRKRDGRDGLAEKAAHGIATRPDAGHVQELSEGHHHRRVTTDEDQRASSISWRMCNRPFSVAWLTLYLRGVQKDGSQLHESHGHCN